MNLFISLLQNWLMADPALKPLPARQMAQLVPHRTTLAVGRERRVRSQRRAKKETKEMKKKLIKATMPVILLATLTTHQKINTE